jgi:hypothetical protein
MLKKIETSVSRSWRNLYSLPTKYELAYKLTRGGYPIVLVGARLLLFISRVDAQVSQLVALPP